MAISKRTRFEVLRRDGHTCRYCGARAPEARITIDHVLPVALGGTDTPDNLVACCAPCNAGKTSTSPTESLVGDIDQAAIRYRAARHQVIEERRASAEAASRRNDSFLAQWAEWDKEFRWLPEDWQTSIGYWLDDGLPMEELCEAVDLAWLSTHVRPPKIFRYLAGIVRNKIADIDQATQHALTQVEPPRANPEDLLASVIDRRPVTVQKDAGVVMEGA